MQALGGIKYIFLTHRDDGEVLHMYHPSKAHITIEQSMCFQSPMATPASP